MFLRKKKVTFDITGTEYLSRILSLFGKEGLELTLKELDILLLLRSKTDQILLERNEQCNNT